MSLYGNHLSKHKTRKSVYWNSFLLKDTILLIANLYAICLMLNEMHEKNNEILTYLYVFPLHHFPATRQVLWPGTVFRDSGHYWTLNLPSAYWESTGFQCLLGHMIRDWYFLTCVYFNEPWRGWGFFVLFPTMLL